MSDAQPDITGLLERWKTGDKSIEDQLFSAVYPVLREIAAAQVRRNSGVLTMQATELANEAYTRFAAQQEIDWKNREHFFAIAATVIRRVVIDYLRLRGRGKRGGRLPLVSLADLREDQTPTFDENADWIGLDEALTDLAGVDPDCARTVELKFFSGLNTEQIATVSGSSVATVGRQWRFARAWLGARLGVDSVDP